MAVVELDIENNQIRCHSWIKHPNDCNETDKITTHFKRFLPFDALCKQTGWILHVTSIDDTTTLVWSQLRFRNLIYEINTHYKQIFENFLDVGQSFKSASFFVDYIFTVKSAEQNRSGQAWVKHLNRNSDATKESKDSETLLIQHVRLNEELDCKSLFQTPDGNLKLNTEK